VAEPGTFEKLLAEIGQALLPLRGALSSPGRFSGFVIRLGWEVDAVPEPLHNVADGIDGLLNGLAGLVGGGGLSAAASGSFEAGSGGAGASPTVDVSADAVARVVTSLQQVIGGIRAVATAPPSAFSASLQADGFAKIFPRQLIDYLIIRHLVRFHPRIAFALHALGVIKAAYQAKVGGRLPYIHLSLDLTDLPQVLADLSLVLKTAFGWGQPDFGFPRFAAELDKLLVALDIDIAFELTPPSVALALQGIPAPDLPLKAIRGVVFERMLATGRMAAEVSLLPLPAKGSLKPGVALLPAFNGPLNVAMQLGPDISVTIKSDLDLQGGVGLLIRPGQPIEILVGFAKGTPAKASGSIDVRAQRDNDEGEPVLILGAPKRTRLEYRKIGGVGGVRLIGGKADLFAEVELRGLAFHFEPSEADGFIATVVPDGGFGFATDLTLGLSHRDGFYFRGSSQPEIQVPAHVQLGLIDIQALSISASPSGSTVPIGLAVTFAAELGPVRAVVEQIGLSAVFAFKANQDGNLGPLDLALRFKPPNGIGLSINAAAVTGGGYLKFDPVRGEYAGALELQLAEFLTLKAIGIITTKLPDGTKGYSLLIILSEDFGPGIQLGLGFKLLAVGGLLGLHRRMDRAALTEGVRSGAITSVMFPQDIIANAPKIVSDLRAFFPVREDTFLIGPMVKLGWGTPTLVTISVAVIMEIPGDVALLGVLRAALPSDDVAVIVLQAHIDGTIELDKKRAYFVAQLFESHVVFLPLDGRIGVFVAYGDDPNFIITVGGFHPKFEPPALPFEVPERISVSLLNSSKARVSVQGYLAITSNTVQAGARVEVFFGLSKLNVKGHLGFDALLQVSPLHFTAEISASLSANVFGKGIFSVRVRGKLSGPTPWHIKGHGSISVLFWDIDVNIKKTWGDDRDTQLPPIAILPLLQAELSKPQVWRAIPPDTSRLLVTLRTLGPTETAQVLHPTGVLRVSQRAVPLDLTLTRVGSQQPSDVNRVTLTVSSAGLVSKADTYEQFAPAQFTDHSDADKLSLPAFSKQHSGLDLAPAGADTRTSQAVKRVVRYEEIIIDKTFTPDRRRFRDFPAVLFAFFLGGNSVARSPISKAHKDRLQPFTDRATVTDDTYVVALQATNRPYTPTATFASAASAHDHLARTLAHDPTLVNVLHVIPGFEAAT
jgi:hypothetical protein